MSRNCVSYYRTSSQSSIGSDKDTKKRQKHSVDTYTKSKRWKVIKEFYDKGISGTLDVLNRPSFVEMLSFCENNSIDTIVFESSDRMSRDLLIMETGFQYLTSLGYKLISVSNPDTFVENTPTGTMIRQVLGVISQFEKSNLVEELKGSRLRKRSVMKNKGIITREGKGRVEGRMPLIQKYPELELLVKNYSKTMNYTEITKVLEKENGIIIHKSSIPNILKDIKLKKKEERNRKRRKNG